MKTKGMANHFKSKTERIVIAANKYFFQLFFRLKSLNLRLIMGREETIKKESTKINPYKNHLLSNRSINHFLFEYQYKSGKEATRIPVAGTGKPLKE
jgi:hypothetical protein